MKAIVMEPFQHVNILPSVFYHLSSERTLYIELLFIWILFIYQHQHHYQHHQHDTWKHWCNTYCINLTIFNLVCGLSDDEAASNEKKAATELWGGCRLYWPQCCHLWALIVPHFQILQGECGHSLSTSCGPVTTTLWLSALRVCNLHSYSKQTKVCACDCSRENSVGNNSQVTPKDSLVWFTQESQVMFLVYIHALCMQGEK